MAGSGVFPKISNDNLSPFDINGILASFTAGSQLGTIPFGSGASFSGLAAGTIGNFLTASGAAAPYWGATAAGALTLLQGSTFSQPGSLWISGIATGYRAFLIMFSIGSYSVNANCALRLNNDTNINYTTSSQRVSAGVQTATSRSDDRMFLTDPNGGTGTARPIIGKIFITNGIQQNKTVSSSMNMNDDQHISTSIWSIGSEINAIQIYADNAGVLIGSPTQWAVWGLK